MMDYAFAIYCKFGTYLEIPKGCVLLYSEQEMTDLFKKHMKAGCELVNKQVMRAETKKRNKAVDMASRDAGGRGE